MARDVEEAMAVSFEAYRDVVWGACYRMSGTVQDADDLTQETFLRLRERPPENLDEPLRGWLLTVAANLCRDRLRRRKKIDYVGQWLPEPAAFDATSPWFVAEGRGLSQDSAESTMIRLESASYAFLLAMEELTANERSVLLLRDVYEFSVRETAEALQLTPANVKTTHHRARSALKGLEPGERGYGVREEGAREATQAVLAEFLQCMSSGDFERLHALLRDDARLVSDGGGGEFHAATRPVVGAAAIAAFLRGLATGLARGAGEVLAVEQVILNALPALVVDIRPVSERQTPHFVLRLELDPARQIREIHLLLGTEKVSGARAAAGLSR